MVERERTKSLFRHNFSTPGGFKVTAEIDERGTLKPSIVSTILPDRSVPKSLTNLPQIEEGMMLAILNELLMPLNRSDSSIQNNTNLQRNK